jgi:hypothetical protein
LLILTELSVDIVSNKIVFGRVFADSSGFHLEALHCDEVFGLVEVMREVALFFEGFVKKPSSKEEDPSGLEVVNS